MVFYGKPAKLFYCLAAFWAAANLPSQAQSLFAIDRIERTSSAVHLRFSGAADQYFRLETSQDLKDWYLLSRQFALPSTDQILTFTDLQANEARERYYRIARVSQADGPGRPNILFIMTDDQAPWALGEAVHPHAVTPHMDRIFKEGARLESMYTPTPVCSPSRATLMTSRYGTELGITDWIHPGNEPELGLDPDTVVWPELLSDAGYSTGLVGKWHLGLPDRFHPTKMGFQYFMGFRGGGNSPSEPTLEKEGRTAQFRGFTPDILTDHALGFIRDHTQEAWVLSVHYRAPHAPWLPVHEEDWDLFRNLDPQLPHPDYPKLDVSRVKRMTREYLASVKSVDRNVGRMLDELDALGISENTIVIFTSDHGYNMGHNGIWHKGNGHWVLTDPPPATENIPRGQRPNMYDHSLRVPTAIRWPARIQPGTVVEETLTFLDWYPTLLAMAGVALPQGVELRGRNFLPLLSGESIDWNNSLFGQYSTHHQSRTHMRMWRTREWKLVRDFLNPERDELYHLSADPDESSNLIHSSRSDVQEIIGQFHAEIVAKMESINDPAIKQVRRLYGPPDVLEVKGDPGLTAIRIHFSKPVAHSSAANLENYQIESLQVTGIKVHPDRESVELQTSEQVPGMNYTVRVSGLVDDEGRHMNETAEQTFSAWEIVGGGLLMEVYKGIDGTSLGALENASNFPDAPDQVELVSEFESPTNVHDSYGVRLRGWLIPKETGSYVFYVCSDDDGTLLLSSDESRENLIEIARDPSWHRPRDWLNPERRQVVQTLRDRADRLENESVPIHLEAGKRYAIEARMKDGTGGDNLSVTWRKREQDPPEKGAAPISSEFLSAN